MNFSEFSFSVSFFCTTQVEVFGHDFVRNAVNAVNFCKKCGDCGECDENKYFTAFRQVSYKN